MKKRKTEKPKKPSISKEARERISAFVKAVDLLQQQYEDDGLVLRDLNRKEDWKEPDGSVYGNWDACILNGPLRVGSVHFETFDGWGEK